MTLVYGEKSSSDSGGGRWADGCMSMLLYGIYRTISENLLARQQHFIPRRWAGRSRRGIEAEAAWLRPSSLGEESRAGSEVVRGSGWKVSVRC